MRQLVAVAGILALLNSVAVATPVVVDGNEDCAPVSGLNLIQPWMKVYVGEGIHTIALEASDFSSSATQRNQMVLVYCDQVAPASAERLVFSLNGVGDSANVEFLPGGRVFLGFVDTQSSDNSGGSTVSISGIPGKTYVDGVINCTEAPSIFSDFVFAEGCGAGDYTVSLVESDFVTHSEIETHMVFVLCSQQDSSACDYWLFTLNGIGDANSIPMCEGAGLYLGFVGQCGGNYGSSTVDVDADCMNPVSESRWGIVKALFR